MHDAAEYLMGIISSLMSPFPLCCFSLHLFFFSLPVSLTNTKVCVNHLTLISRFRWTLVSLFNSETSKTQFFGAFLDVCWETISCNCQLSCRIHMFSFCFRYIYFSLTQKEICVFPLLDELLNKLNVAFFSIQKIYSVQSQTIQSCTTPLLLHNQADAKYKVWNY